MEDSGAKETLEAAILAILPSVTLCGIRAKLSVGRVSQRFLDH